MGDKFILELYTEKQTKWMEGYKFQPKKNRQGSYFLTETDQKEMNHILTKARKSHIRYRCYGKEWARAPGCRDRFFRENPGPYRCRYCNRWLAKEQVVVDHIIPVNKAKSSQKARNMLRRSGMTSVNDIRNLAPSCPWCNSRKGDKIGLWYLRGIFGKYKVYWAFVYTILLAVAIIGVYSLWHLYFIGNLTKILGGGR